MEYDVCVQLLLMQNKDPSSWTLLYYAVRAIPKHSASTDKNP